MPEVIKTETIETVTIVPQEPVIVESQNQSYGLLIETLNPDENIDSKFLLTVV